MSAWRVRQAGRFCRWRCRSSPVTVGRCVAWPLQPRAPAARSSRAARLTRPDEIFRTQNYEAAASELPKRLLCSRGLPFRREKKSLNRETKESALLPSFWCWSFNWKNVRCGAEPSAQRAERSESRALREPSARECNSATDGKENIYFKQQCCWHGKAMKLRARTKNH